MWGEIFIGMLLFEAVLALWSWSSTKESKYWWVNLIIWNMGIIVLLGLVICFLMVIYFIKMF